ncbi:MAG: hypothetical protein ACFFEV_01145 [Candidatus Thorarchaeota archaeon]
MENERKTMNCPKCGMRIEQFRVDPVPPDPLPPIRRRCSKCGHEWYER